MMVRTRLLVASVTLLLAGGCFYKFNNPVSTQANGSIAGTLVLENPAAGQTLDQATASLQWSGLSVAVGPSDGKFIFLSLSDGTFTLRYDLPAIGSNDFPLIGFRYDLLIPPGGGGLGDAVNLGNVPITPSGRVVGNYSGADPVGVAAFTPDLPDGGPAGTRATA